MEIKYLSLFSGIGGFELGIQNYVDSFNRNQNQKSSIDSQANAEARQRLESAPGKGTGGTTGRNSKLFDGDIEPRKFNCIGFSEIDRYAIQTYQKHFPDHKNYGNIKTIDAEKLPDFDLLVGGFPCQPFSIAGRRGGFLDTRGTLFFEIARIIRTKQPRLLLLENVKGLLSHGNGDTFYKIITTLDELGYDLQWQVLNSKDFGVPQNRQRVFIVGNLRGTSRPEVFPIGSDDSFAETTQYKTRQDVANTLRAKQGGPDLENSYFIDQRPRGKNNGGHKELAPTLTGKSYQDNNHVGGIRKLTPLECERLQGFPDGWTEGLSDTQRYKTLGNAVTVNVIQAIIERLT